MKLRPWRRFGVAAAAATALVASLAVVTPPTPASAAGSAETCTSSTLTDVRKRILKDVNAARDRADLTPLRSNADINSVALKWSKKQADAEQMSHNPKYTSQIPKGWYAAGENVAYGYSPSEVTRAWLDSKGHRENILRSSFTHIGIGVACSDKGRPYYTQVFGGYKTLKAGTPAIAGTAKTGKKLVAKPGTWTSGTKLRYQWYVGGKAVSGATATAYVPKTKDAGKSVKVKVTGSKAGFIPTAKVSKATPKVAPSKTLTTSVPKISGTPKVGKKLTIIRGTWTTDTKFTYKWYRSGTLIKGATSKTYVLTKADRGKVIKVKVTGKKTGYKSVSVKSAATSKVS